MIVPSELITALKEYETFVVIGHQEPDGDALGSQLALASFLDRRGKRVVPVSPGPFERPEIAHKEKFFLKHLPSGLDAKSTLIIVVDCSTIDRIGYLGSEITEFKTAVVDHHSSGEVFGDIHYIDSSAPSVTFLIQNIIEITGDTPTKEEARLLFFGLATDTGFFRHLDKGTGAVFASAGRLIDAGASPKEAHSEMYGGRSFESRQLLGVLLGRARKICGGRLITIIETKEDVDRFGKMSRDSDMLYQLVFGIKGVDAIVLIRYEKENEYSVGLRSISNIDVGSVARMYGGGGHFNAAGFTWNREPGEIEQELTGLLCREL